MIRRKSCKKRIIGLVAHLQTIKTLESQGLQLCFIPSFAMSPVIFRKLKSSRFLYVVVRFGYTNDIFSNSQGTMECTHIGNRKVSHAKFYEAIDATSQGTRSYGFTFIGTRSYKNLMAFETFASGQKHRKNEYIVIDIKPSLLNFPFNTHLYFQNRFKYYCSKEGLEIQ